jgi:two-component system, OmpR family, sensor histidine kinase TctE
MTDLNNPRRSLRRTLLRWLLIPLLTLLAISAVVAYGIALNFARDAYDRALYESAYDISELVKNAVQEGKLPFKLSAAARQLMLSDKYDDIYYNIRDEKGVVLSGDGKLPAPPVDTAQEDEKGDPFYDALVDDKSVRVATLPLTLTINNNESRVHIQVAETLHKREVLAKDILTGLILPQLLLILLAAGIVWYAVGRGLRSLIRLEASVAARSHLDLSPVQDPDAPAEAQPLVSAINALLQRLEGVLNAQNRFIANAAHQLRTPLAGLKAQIALASRQNTLEAARHSLDQLEIGAEQLTHLVNQLLSLARNETGADRSLKLVPLDLNTLAQSITGEWISVAVKKGIDLGFESAGMPVWVNGDALRLTELLKNLLDNALRYTPNNGTVTVRVRPDLTLEVEDSGTGIPEEEKARVFERFHRLLGHQADGSGLGLAIVKEIAEIHGASVAVRDGINNRGSCFSVMFPPVTEPNLVGFTSDLH